MKTFTRNPVTTFGLIACLCAATMTGSEAIAQNGVLDLRRAGSPAVAASAQTAANRSYVQTQQYETTHYGHHGQPIYYKTFDIVVHPGRHKAVKVHLHPSTPYAITAQHNPGSVYPQVYPPPPDDVKLRVMRYWNGHLKMDRHMTGLGSASLSLTSTHWGVRPYVIKVYNHSSYAQRFQLTVSAQQAVQPQPRPIYRPLPQPIIQPPIGNPGRPPFGFNPPAIGKPPIHRPDRDRVIGVVRKKGVPANPPLIKIPEIKLPGIN